MNDLKTKIARGEYEIDSRDVAEAIVAKLRTVSRVRGELAARGEPRRSARFDAATRSPERRQVAH